MARKAEIQKREKERGGRTKEREERGRREKIRLSHPPTRKQGMGWSLSGGYKEMPSIFADQ
jgi:hypothetical protein